MTHRPPARRSARLVLVTAVLGLVVAGAPLAAGAQDAPTGAPTLAQVLDGEVAGVAAVATTTSIDELDMGVVLEITNDGDDPVDGGLRHRPSHARSSKRSAIAPSTRMQSYFK